MTPLPAPLIWNKTDLLLSVHYSNWFSMYLASNLLTYTIKCQIRGFRLGVTLYLVYKEIYWKISTWTSSNYISTGTLVHDVFATSLILHWLWGHQEWKVLFTGFNQLKQKSIPMTKCRVQYLLRRKTCQLFTVTVSQWERSYNATHNNKMVDFCDWSF